MSFKASQAFRADYVENRGWDKECGFSISLIDVLKLEMGKGDSFDKVANERLLHLTCWTCDQVSCSRYVPYLQCSIDTIHIYFHHQLKNELFSEKHDCIFTVMNWKLTTACDGTWNWAHWTFSFNKIEFAAGSMNIINFRGSVLCI